ncbi:hypothetical protein MIND_01128500 [Mycena indigotica]|uniref:DUF7923 domain-containing protein n=1 Tax=Mycena indigotica TaxID=2126181 RepID=A0A8H6S7B0_9AGAR|nr:uncharacterized protein MIND_01128500 [Mycena indigotica]KAF7293505.1 hypothetical protein MIND_01128500 [Mycena indigotica]
MVPRPTTPEDGAYTQKALSFLNVLSSVPQIRDDSDEEMRKMNAHNELLEEQVAWLRTQLEETYIKHFIEKESAAKREVIFQQQLLSLVQQSQLSTVHAELFKISLPLVFTVINGDELLFSHLSHGFDGGVHTATVLTQNIVAYLQINDLATYHGSVSHFMTVFYNRRRLIGQLRARGICTIQQFNQFLTGFSISHEGYSFVDVSGLDQTEAKINAYINTFIQLPQTVRVFFAGRRNGPLYCSFLKTFSRARILGKFVMIGQYPQFNTVPEVALLVVDNVFGGSRASPIRLCRKTEK